MTQVVEFLQGFNPFVEPVKPITSKNCTVRVIFAEDAFQIDFFTKISQEDLTELANAANFMNIKVLLNSCCCAIAIIYKTAALNYAKNELGLDSDELSKPLKGDEELDLKL